MRAELGRDGTLQVRFTYDPDLVVDMKRIPGARWNKGQGVWTAPLTSFAEVKKFVWKNGGKVASELELIELPTKKQTSGLRVVNGAIALSFPYDRVQIAAAKQIPGIQFIKDAWIVPPNSLSEAIKFCDQFDLPAPQALRGVVDFQKSRLAAMVSLSRAKDGVEVVVPIQGELKPHQHVAVEYISRTRRTFVADDIGVGKTLTAIAALEYVHTDAQPSYPALIICPPKLALNWKKEYERWLPGRSVFVVRQKKDPVPKDVDVVVIGNSIIAAKKLELRGFRSLVCDESHAFKTLTAQRTKAAKFIASTVPKEGVILNLTGTPITIRPAEYVPQLEILGLIDQFGGQMGFYRSFCDAHKDANDKWDFSGAINTEFLNEQLRGTCYVRRLREDVLTDLQPTAPPTDILVELEGKWLKEYQKAQADVVAYLVARAREIAIELGLPIRSAEVKARMKAEAGRHLVEISVLRRLSAMGKIEAASEWIQERIDEDRKVIVAAHHRDVVDALAARFGGLKIQGGQSVKEVEAHKERFQTKPCSEAPVIVLSIQAAKEGHTLTAAQDVLFVELAWTSTDIDQTWGRAWRQGQKGKVFVTYMLGANTLDVPMFDMIGLRRIQVGLATQGRDTSADVVASLLDLGLLDAA